MKMSIHTGNGCTMPTDFGGTGTLSAGTNCYAYVADNTGVIGFPPFIGRNLFLISGCGIVNSGLNTYGEGYNSNGGGVHIMIWDNTSSGNGIRMWFFPRGGIPFDISTNEPQPDGWGTPQAIWPASSCSPPQFFKDHVLVFDATLWYVDCLWVNVLLLVGLCAM